MIKKLCAQLMTVFGWSFKINLPANLKSFVFIGAPHTSNCDFFPAMAVIYLMQRKARFVIKNSWLKFPMNLILKPLGAIGINREFIKNQGGDSTTDLMATLFKNDPDLVLMISPEGTRSPNSIWKTGFYYIAQKANVPIVLGFVDYKKKQAGVEQVIYPTNFQQDMTTIMKYYQDKEGKHPDKFKLDERYL